MKMRLLEIAIASLLSYMLGIGLNNKANRIAQALEHIAEAGRCR